MKLIDTRTESIWQHSKNRNWHFDISIYEIRKECAFYPQETDVIVNSCEVDLFSASGRTIRRVSIDRYKGQLAYESLR